MKKKNLFIVIIPIIIILLLILFFIFKDKILSNDGNKLVNTKTDNYVLYLKINPSFKLNYSQVCNEYKNGKVECLEPTVENYELINNDAKDIFKDVDLLKDTKELSKVIDKICVTAKEKGIDTSNVQIQSDWNKINEYLENKQTEKKKDNQEQTNNGNNQENNVVPSDEIYNYSVSISNEETIDTSINEDVMQEQKEIEEQKKKEEEAKKKAEEEAKKKEEEAKKKAATTIKLSNNVKYCHSMQTYECDNCFTTALINTLKNAKGHYVQESSSSRITILRITKLTDPYNSTNYYGTNYINRITKAGGENVGGAGGCDDLLTKAVCKQFHLTCE